MAKKGAKRMVDKLMSPSAGLLVDEFEAAHAAGQTQMIPVVDIDPDPLQPRQFFDEEDMAELERSVKEKGEVVQPIAVRPVDGRFIIIWGERRWRSAKKSGVLAVPALVKNCDAEEALELALVENVPRAGLTALELAIGLVRLMDARGYGKAQAGAVLGMSPTTTSKHFKVAGLPSKVRQLLSKAKIPLDQLYAVAQVEDVGEQLEMAKRVAAGESSRDETRAKAKGARVDKDLLYVKRVVSVLQKMQVGRRKGRDYDALIEQLRALEAQIERLLGAMK